MTDLLAQLKTEVGRRNITQVAVALDIPRCTLSLVVNGKYPGNPKNILLSSRRCFASCTARTLTGSGQAPAVQPARLAALPRMPPLYQQPG